MNVDIDPWCQQAEKPVFKFLVPFLFLARTECSADEIVSPVIHAPENIRVIFPVQGSGIRQSRDVFPDFLRIGVVMFELDPLRFTRQRTERCSTRC